VFLCCPFLIDGNQQEEGRVPIFVAVERLQEASQQAGLSEDDIVGLLASGLDVCDAVVYLEAMLSNRVH
jgi:hypothetical protein